MKKLKVVFFLFCICNFVSAQKSQFQWVKQLEGSRNSSGWGNAIALDDIGNIYTTGFFSGTNDFDPGLGEYNLTAEGSGDAFVLKLNASGDFVWAKKIGGEYFDNTNALAIDNDGNICITGYFEGLVDFNSGQGVANLNASSQRFQGDIFILKLNDLGGFIWVKQLGGLLQKESSAITIDSKGNILTVGRFNGSLEFNTDTGQCVLNSNGGDDVFILKLSANGQCLWVKNLGGQLDDYISSIVVDVNNDIIATGSFQELVDFDSDLIGTFTLKSNGAGDIFVLKIHEFGNFVWAKSIGGDSWDNGNGITVDTMGSIYITGGFTHKADFNPGSAIKYLSASSTTLFGNIFILKLDVYGNYVWAKNFEGTSAGQGLSIAIDDFGNIFTTGYFNETFDFDPGLGVYNLTVYSQIGNDDIFISKLNGLGEFVWAKKIGGMYSDNSYSIAVDAVGNTFTTGSFSGTADFDPGEGTYFLTSNGPTDVFIHKIDTSVKHNPIIPKINYFKFYPNPTEGLLQVVFPKPEILVRIEVFNSVGELVYLIETLNEINEIDLGSFAFGLYIVKVMSDGNLIAKQKIIKL
ncbi:MAG: SBBP repeat-containing protein [Bacteroidota bacterium]